MRPDANQSQISGGDADVDHTQIIGMDTAKLLGGIYPPGFRHPCLRICHQKLQQFHVWSFGIFGNCGNPIFENRKNLEILFFKIEILLCQVLIVFLCAFSLQKRSDYFLLFFAV